MAKRRNINARFNQLKQLRVNQITQNDRGRSHHIACITSDKLGTSDAITKTNGALSIGYNHYTIQDCHIGTSTHAEVHAINNLPASFRKNTPIYMYVLRTDRTGSIKYSKPCAKCQKFMQKTLKHRGYYLKKIYYTVNDHLYETL